MDKKSYNRFVFLIILCTGFLFLNFNGQLQSLAAPPATSAQGVKNAPSASTSSSAAQPAANKPQTDNLPLAIQDLFLKSNQVWIVISRTGKGDLKVASYPRIIVKVTGSKTTGSKQWTLAQVDPEHTLLQATGKIEFNTELILKKADRLTASISFGTWKTVKQKTLNPASLIAGTPIDSSAGTQKPTVPAQPPRPAQVAGPARPAPPTPPAPVPRGGGTISGVTMQANLATKPLTRPTIPGGLTFAVPGAGQTVTAGDALYFTLRFEHSIAEGDVTLTLRRAGSSTAQATATYHYRPIEGEWSISSTLAIPDHGLAAADDYFLHAVHAAGNTGVSPLFAVHLRGTEGLIRILKPATRDVYNPKMLMRVNYQLTRAAAGGLIRFEMFSQSTSRPVLSWTSDYHAQPAGAPQPVLIKQIKLPADLPFSNNYFIQATHAEGSGRSGTFSVAPLINHGGAEVVEDIAVTDIVKDASGVVKVRARVTGARWPMWVQCYPDPPGATAVILHPGDNEFTIDSAEFNGAGGDCSRTFAVRLDPNNRYTETNETNNNLEKALVFLDRNGKLSVFDHSLHSTLHIPYDSNHLRRRAFDFVFHYCGIDRNNIWFMVREIRQRGTKHWSIGDVNFDQVVPYEKWVTDDCDHLGREWRENSFVEPGQCVFVRINQDGLERVESDVTLYLNEPYASWPGVQQPLTVHIDWTH